MIAPLRPLRALITADRVGGVWSYVLELLSALDEAAELVLAVSGGVPRAQREALERRANVVAVEPLPPQLEWMPDPWADVDAADERLLALERAYAPDVVHLNAYAHGALPLRAPVLVVGHSCVCSWFEAVRGREAPREWDEYRRRVRAGLAGADLVAAPTRAMLAALERHYGPLRAARVLPNARRAALFPPGRKDPLVLAAGRLWDEAKNLEAVGRVAGRLPWPVFFAGPVRSPSDEPGAPGEAWRWERARGTHLLGALPPEVLASWLARASIFVHPARYEPFGLGPLEAALAGAALVLGDIPSLREVWGPDARYVPPGDDDALAAALRDLIERPTLRRELAGRAQERARRYGPERFARGYLDAYRWLIAAAAEQDELARPALAAEVDSSSGGGPR